MNVVMIIPTGIGCEIGGHAGDANPAVKLIGKCCDKIIINPNAVNASDINEMPDNALYVEGSILDRFLRGEIYLKEVYFNKIILAVNKPKTVETINSLNAARTTTGANIVLIELDTKLTMTGFYKDGKANGKVDGWLELCEQVENYYDGFDALAVQTHIEVSEETKMQYLTGKGGVNPFGGVEAIASKLIADKLDKPIAHAPFYDMQEQIADIKKLRFVSDPRMAAEMVSTSYLHCLLKGLHKAPRISYDRGLSVNEVDFLITPINCIGEPHWACVTAGITVIAVKENKTILNDKMPESFIVVENYIEAAGVLMAYRAGIDPKAVRRPI